MELGQPEDSGRIDPVARAHGIKVLPDTAQGFGANLNDRVTGTFGDATGTSLSPPNRWGAK